MKDITSVICFPGGRIWILYLGNTYFSNSAVQHFYSENGRRAVELAAVREPLEMQKRCQEVKQWRTWFWWQQQVLSGGKNTSHYTARYTVPASSGGGPCAYWRWLGSSACQREVFPSTTLPLLPMRFAYMSSCAHRGRITLRSVALGILWPQLLQKYRHLGSVWVFLAIGNVWE